MTNQLPGDFITLLSQVLDNDTVARLSDSLNGEPTISIRANPNKITSELSTSKIPWCATGFYLDARPSFTLDPLFHAGAYYVQEASSMFLEQFYKEAIGPEKSIKALDLCAAPGGKSTHLLSLMNSNSLLVSNEVIRSRAGILSENMEKWGNANVLVTQNDPSNFKDLNGFFDLIVVDAPCSGEGLFRKDSKARNEWSLQNVHHCSERQRRILTDIYPALAKGGVMIYSTCTFNSIENEENLKWLANQHDVEFIKIPNANSFGIDEVEENGVIGYRFYPHQLKGEGFFISGMVKQEEVHPIGFRKKKSFKANREIPNILKSWLKSESDLANIGDDVAIKLFPSNWTTEAFALTETLNCIQMGIRAGEMMHDKFIPGHALAISSLLNKAQVETTELSKEEAIRYLRKEPLHLPEGLFGFRLMTYQGIGLGWMNCLSNRSNNLYPTNWRIRMKG